MTEAEVITLINSEIATNGNNEITANVLRTVMLAVLEQPNDKSGELSDLDTTDKSSIVNAINELFNLSSSSFEIHAGTADPNVTPPASYSIGDWYIRSGISIYQYNGSTWVLLANSLAVPLEVEIDGFLVSTSGKTDLENWEVGDKFRGWVGNVFYVGRIVSITDLSMPTDILDSTKISLAINAPAI